MAAKRTDKVRGGKPAKKPRRGSVARTVADNEGKAPPPRGADVAVGPEPDHDAWGPDGLTLKQRRFAESYVGEAAGNGVKAARLAGYRDDNYHALGVTASENLKKPKVRGYIGRLLARAGAAPRQLRSRLAELSQSSLDNFLTIDDAGDVVVDLKQAAALGALGQLKELKEEVLRTEAGGATVIRRTIKVHDPQPAIRTLAEMQGKIVKRHKVTGKIGHEHSFDFDGFSKDFERFAGATGRGTDPPDRN